MRIVGRFFAVVAVALTFSINPAVSEESAADKLLALSQSIEAVQREIPAYYLSPEALAESNDYEPEQIVSWVKHNIQFKPSPGYQLTPQHSLQTVTGNSLEQAVLLQNVLVQAGLEVRLATATLTTEQAMTLLQESFTPSPVRQWELDPTVREKSFKAFSLQLNQSADAMSKKYAVLESLTPWKDSPVYKEAQALATNFSRALKDTTQWRTRNDLLQPWVENAKDYYFVKYRFSQGEPWAEAHPAFAESIPAIAQSTYVTQGIENLHHHITVQAFITRSVEGKRETISVSPLVKRTVAGLVEDQLQFGTVASGLQKAFNEKSLAALYASQFFAPSIDGEIAPSTRFFTLKGTDFSPAEINDPMGKLGGAANQNINRATSQLSGALGSSTTKSQAQSKIPNERKKTSQLLHYYLAVEWSAPNGKTRSLTRTIYRAETGQDATQAYNQITQSATLGAVPATPSPPAVLFNALETQISAFTLLAKLRSQNYTESQVAEQLGAWAKSKKDLVFDAAVQISERAAGSTRLFSQAPVLAMRWHPQSSKSSSAQAAQSTSSNSRITFDYLINAAQVAVLSQSGVTIDRAKTQAHGVWSTYAVGILMSGSQRRDQFPQSSGSAASDFNKQTAQNGFTVFSAEKLKATQQSLSTSVSSSLAERIIDNPELLYLVPKSAEANPTMAYYRVDPSTGETLGYSQDGRGSATVEVSIVQQLWINNLITAGKLIGCVVGAGESTDEFVRCGACTILQHVLNVLAVLVLSPHAAIWTEGAGDVACQFA